MDGLDRTGIIFLSLCKIPYGSIQDIDLSISVFHFNQNFHILEISKGLHNTRGGARVSGKRPRPAMEDDRLIKQYKYLR